MSQSHGVWMYKEPTHSSKDVIFLRQCAVFQLMTLAMHTHDFSHRKGIWVIDLLSLYIHVF